MTKAWDYMRSRGARERGKKKYKDKPTTEWDFEASERSSVPSTGDIHQQVSVEDELKIGRRLLAQGWTGVEQNSMIGRLARQVGVDLKELPPGIGTRDSGLTWIPAWFTALYMTYIGTKQVAGAVEDGFAQATEALRNDSRLQIVTIGEFLLTSPHAGDAAVAAKAFVERYIRAHPRK